MERKNVSLGAVGLCVFSLIERHTGSGSTRHIAKARPPSLRGQMPAGMIDKHVSHDPCGESQELRVREAFASKAGCHPHIRLMHERGRLKGVPGCLGGDVPRGELPEFPVHTVGHRGVLVRRRLVHGRVSVPRGQNYSEIRRGLLRRVAAGCADMPDGPLGGSRSGCAA